MGHSQHNYHNSNFRPLLLLVIGLLMVLVACSKVERPTVAASQAPQITLTSTKLPPTATSTNVPASATPTATFTPAGPTATPKIVPTLNLEQSQLAENFIQGAEDCQLPCWHGITPGVSIPSTVPYFFEKLGVSYDLERVRESSSGDSFIYVKYYPDYADASILWLEVYWNETTVSSIYLLAVPGYEDFLDVYKVIDQLGPPEVLELGFTLNHGPNPEYSILMIYEEERIAFSFEGFTRHTQNGVLQMCLTSIVQAWIYTDGEEPYHQYRLFERADYWGDMSKYEITEAEFLDSIYTLSKDGYCVDFPEPTFLNSESP